MSINLKKKNDTSSTLKDVLSGTITALTVLAIASIVLHFPKMAFALSIKTEVIATVKLDSDHDGAPDDWERENGLDSNYPIDGFLDLDNDGVVNVYEFVDGTDPNDPKSFNPNSYQKNLENAGRFSVVFMSLVKEYKQVVISDKFLRTKLDWKPRFLLLVDGFGANFETVRELALQIDSLRQEEAN